MTGAERRVLACRKVRGRQLFQYTILPAESFQFTILLTENGYRLLVNHGATEYVWPDLYSTLEKAGEQVLKALTTASECRAEPHHDIREFSPAVDPAFNKDRTG
jgi:hypothetical protein